MARIIKGFEFQERIRDAWEEYKAVKLYKGMYKAEDVKIMAMVNQFGQPYTDIYIRKNAKPARQLTAKFGSAMTFKDKEGTLYGDSIKIRNRRK